VIDGDTIRVRPLERTRRRRYTVRLIGIDTPEVFGGVECGGRRASARLKRLATGRRVLLRTDPTQATFDRYDRLLAYANLRGGPDLGISQLRAGWARVYVYGGRPFRRVRAYRRAQRSARRADRGVWSRCGGRFQWARRTRPHYSSTYHPEAHNLCEQGWLERRWFTGDLASASTTPPWQRWA
jgi:endonuclease YncB( thermonuclease family)